MSECECMVCGKLFPRGVLDLIRHQTAITLKHTTSSEPTDIFQFSCRRCSLYFASKEHVQMHKFQSSCNKLKSTRQQQDNTSQNSGEVDTSIDQDESIILVKAATNKASIFPEGSKTIECMVCGKIFPRGIFIY